MIELKNGFKNALLLEKLNLNSELTLKSFNEAKLESELNNFNNEQSNQQDKISYLLFDYKNTGSDISRIEMSIKVVKDDSELFMKYSSYDGEIEGSNFLNIPSEEGYDYEIEEFIHYGLEDAFNKYLSENKIDVFIYIEGEQSEDIEIDNIEF